MSIHDRAGRDMHPVPARFFFPAFFLMATILGFAPTWPPPAEACDDAVLALLTSEDREGSFGKGLREFNRLLTVLGGELKTPRTMSFASPLEAVMSYWIGFSNRWALNPPEMGNNDPNWGRKFNTISDRIGRIRALIREQKLLEAHDEVLAVSDSLSGFFAHANLSPLRRSLLKCEESFAELERHAASRNATQALVVTQELITLVGTFSALLTPDSKPLFEQARSRLDEVRDHFQAQASDSVSLLAQAREEFRNFRSRLLVSEWFPGLKPANGRIAP